MTSNYPGISLMHRCSKAGCHEKFALHTHTTMELFCFLSGKAKYHVEGSEYILHSGDILLMRPAEAHYVETDPSQDYERACINFEPNLLEALDPDATLLQSFLQREAGTNNLYRSHCFHDNAHLTLLQHLLDAQDRLIVLADLILLLKLIDQQFQSGSDALPQSTAHKIMHYISHNLNEDLSLQTLCDRFYISRAQLCRLFRSATGTTVGKYITAKRLITARQWILSGKKPYDVFLTCGYRDYSTFYRAYFRYFGHSPKADTDPSLPKDLQEDRMEIL